VLDLASRGMTNRQVAFDLCVSVHAVKFHLGSVYRKLGVANRTQATMLLYRYGTVLPAMSGDTSDETAA